MLRREVVLQSQQIVSRPFFENVGVRRKLLHDAEGVLHADGLGKPKPPAFEGSRKSEPRIPVSEVHALLTVDSRAGIRRSKAPAVVSIGSHEAQNARARMRVRGANPPGLHLGSARGIDVETRSQRPIHGVADFKSIEQIFGVSRARAGHVQVVEVVLDDLRHRNQALVKDMRVGNRDVANVPRGKRGPLRRVLRIDLVGGRGDLHLFADFLLVIQNQ